jgi:hypothetical protein
VFPVVRPEQADQYREHAPIVPEGTECYPRLAGNGGIDQVKAQSRDNQGGLTRLRAVVVLVVASAPPGAPDGATIS